MLRPHYVVIVVAACGRIHFDELRDASPDACTYGPFSTPVELAELDTAMQEQGPWLSDDRLDIYFASDRLAPGVGSQTFHAHRASPSGAFDPPVEVDLGLGGFTNDPFISPDGLTLWFVYSATGSGADNLLYVATRATTAEPFGSTAALTELNVYGGQATPSLTADALTIVFTSEQAGDPGNGDLYIATRTSATQPFDPPHLLADLSTPAIECCSAISADGSSLVYLSDVLSPGTNHIVVSQRVGGVYQSPHLLDPALSGAGGENDPQLTYDGSAIVFVAPRASGTGEQDIYFSERSCLP